MLCVECLQPLNGGIEVHPECADAAYQLASEGGISGYNTASARLHTLCSRWRLRQMLERHPIVADRLNADARIMRMELLGLRIDDGMVRRSDHPH